VALNDPLIERGRGWRNVIGPLIVLVVIVVGGAMLEMTARESDEAWLVRGFLVLGLVAMTVYVFAVALPAARTSRDLRRLVRRHRADCEAMAETLEELRHGDLVGALEPIRDLETDVRQAVEAATRSLAALVQQIQSSSVEVADSAMTVQETSSELASASSEQAAAVVEITATTEELARTAGQIASSASGQAEHASRAEDAGAHGVAALAAASAGVETVRERIDAVAARADTLGRRSREITQVLDLIREIAQETHILALNAAIEASAAGEHGQRFEVVAEEVRRLAERSRESVESVRTLVEEFTGAVRAVVVATEEGSKEVAQVLAQTRSTEEAMAQLRAALADTARAAKEISLATQEQRTASDQVVLTLREVSDVIQRMADGLAQFTGAADRLNEVALSIQLLTQTFRIDSDHSLIHEIASWTPRIGDVTHNLEGAQGRLRELLGACPYTELAYFVDSNGTMVAYAVNPELVGDELAAEVTVGQSYADRPWFLGATMGGRPTVTPLYESLLTGARCFTIAAPVRDRRGAVVGTLGMDINVRDWTRI
jgi:methyl-accepting chemotaxis protein